MKLENRSIAKMLILSFITCGIYGIIWIINLVKDAIKVNNPEDDGMLEILLSLFLPFIGLYLTEKKFAEGCAKQNIPHKDNSILYLILGILGLSIVSACLMQNDLNALADTGYTIGNQVVSDTTEM